MEKLFKIYGNKKRDEIKNEIKLVPISEVVTDKNGDINANRIDIPEVEYETYYWYSLDTPEGVSRQSLMQAIYEKCLETTIEEPVLVVYRNQALIAPFNAGYPDQHKKVWRMYQYNTGKNPLTQYYHNFSFSYERGFVRNPNYRYNREGEYSDYYQKYLQCEESN